MRNEDEARTHVKTAGQSRQFQVIKDYQAQYLDPISIRGGETLVVSEEVDCWNDNPEWVWVWCTDQRGKSGWVPSGDIDVDADGKTGVARCDYSATELSVAVGDGVVVGREESGWLWCTDQQARSGWVPAEHVAGS